MKTIRLTEKQITGMIGAIARARVAYATAGRIDLANIAKEYEDILLTSLSQK